MSTGVFKVLHASGDFQFGATVNRMFLPFTNLIAFYVDLRFEIV
jgi:hypothetical protein